LPCLGVSYVGGFNCTNWQLPQQPAMTKRDDETARAAARVGDGGGWLWWLLTAR